MNLLASEREQLVENLLVGAIDLHCHSGPSVMPRSIDHLEIAREASKVGMKALLFKDHYYSVTPVTQLLMKHFQDLNVELLSGVPLNNTSGGFNRYAVDHGIKLGANLVWMPTFSAANHIRAHQQDKDFEKKFPTTKEKMLEPIPLSILDDSKKLLDEVKFILDLIAENDLVLSSGHLHISEIWVLFDEAKKRGVKRLLCNHPTYIIGASYDDITELVKLGSYIEHSMCMFVEKSKYQFYSPEELDQMIKAAGIEKTILGSDLGQVGNPSPVDGFRGVINMCLDLGYTKEDVHQLVAANAAKLMKI
ncbi:uncharacterized protein METZ01_LOCUS22112 [marine metagenome]|uniref:Amidohydrolase-related domain-containing protein n=1 Tax=marine metagenome TaxID=408172 RepID=A0A381PS03_9ZZZZ|tara:strand:- start:113 stop:1030 length:918 start_codon:yes stop_codon:yes gene_type:complete